MPPPPRNASYAFATPRAQQQSGIPSRPAVPNIHVPQRPPVAAFATSPINEKASSLSPASPFKGSALSDEDDRYGSVVGGNPNMDFWKRFSMTLHDKEMEDQGVKPKQNWLNKQFEGKRKYKVIIWAIACLIIIAIAAALAWHFTHNSNSNSEKAPTQHDFGLGPGSSSANPLATVSVDKGTAKRNAMPLEPHRMRRRVKRAPLPADKRDLPVQAQARLQRAIFNRPHA